MAQIPGKSSDGFEFLKNFRIETRIPVQVSATPTLHFFKTLSKIDGEPEPETTEVPENKQVRRNSTQKEVRPPPLIVRDKNINEGYHPRVVARFKFRDGNPMPLILVIESSHGTGIEDVTTICHIQVTIEHQKRRRRLGQCYNCQRFGHSASNCKADPNCRHCAGAH
ncbi:hypothetical protein JTB14_035677 [Gonioctena quinquepunctata]|nr:hypothetical protein JTB14_035677 [Gonioctena quinquepunctata]